MSDAELKVEDVPLEDVDLDEAPVALRVESRNRDRDGACNGSGEFHPDPDARRCATHRDAAREG
ncbi:hypothetical protein [Mycolicibacterium sediminis]|uniref:hypothetical protein n=1 Tax=Mycolicibacterium sediminis TaxID=1286180 RepID=UPI0013D45D9C|nr:hypothetical protein [Mycolicibacterium sediminis]